MAGIANKYFPIRATTLSVLGMTSARARAAAAPGYALGVFVRGVTGGSSPGRGDGGGDSPPGAGVTGGSSPGGETAFTGLVRDGRVRDLSGFGTVSDLLTYWDDAQRRARDELAARDSGDWADLAGLDVRCPVSPGQILQAGANYRKHVVDIVLAERRANASMTGLGDDLPEAEVRRRAESMMDERAAAGTPYVFAGLPSALTVSLRRDRAARARREPRLGA